MSLIELSGTKIRAVPYRKRRPLKAVAIPDGAIVEKPNREQRQDAPKALPAYLEVSKDGGGTFIGLEGVFRLPSGDVAAIYGAKAEPIG